MEWRRVDTMRFAILSTALMISLAGAAQAQTPQLQRTTDARVRFGADLGLGGGSTGYAGAVGSSTHVRIGAQINDTLAVYYQAALLIGANPAAFFCYLSCTDV